MHVHYFNGGSNICWHPNVSCGHCHIHCWCGDVGQSQEGTDHSSQPPPPGADHYEMVDERMKRPPLGARVYEEVDKQDTQTDGHTKQYQELDLTKMEKSQYTFIKV